MSAHPARCGGTLHVPPRNSRLWGPLRPLRAVRRQFFFFGSEVSRGPNVVGVWFVHGAREEQAERRRTAVRGGKGYSEVSEKILPRDASVFSSCLIAEQN